MTRQNRFDRYLPFSIVLVGAYLLYLCDSKTSIVCLVAGAAIMGASRLPLLRTRIRSLGIIVLVSVLGFFLFDSVFHIKEAVVAGLGRDMTFTGRTDVWRVLLDLHTDPVIGTGFCSFWSDQRYQTKLPEWLADGRSAHNGFLETFIDGGAIGIFFLLVMLVGAALKINRELLFGAYYILMRLATLVAIVIGDFSESHFGRMSPLGFLFLLATIGYAQTARSNQPSLEAAEESAAQSPGLHNPQTAVF